MKLLKDSINHVSFGHAFSTTMGEDFPTTVLFCRTTIKSDGTRWYEGYTGCAVSSRFYSELNHMEDDFQFIGALV